MTRSFADVLSEIPDWRKDALCAETDPEVFFPEKGGSARWAKSICAVCDVREQCLAEALVNGERYGIWGGVTERDRRKLTGLTPIPGKIKVLSPDDKRVALAPEQQAQALDMRASGASYQKIANEFGVAADTIMRLVKRVRRNGAAA